MTLSVVTISRALGAGGEEVGRAISERLGFRYVDDAVIYRAAEKENIAPAVVADVEHRGSIVERIIEALAVSGTLHYADEDFDIRSPAHYREVIREVIDEVAREGDAVIVAHAAGFRLKGSEGLLRVLVTSSPDERVARLVEAGMSEREARRSIEDSDSQRASYLERFYGVKQELPEHYDVVVNTDLFGAEQAAELVMHAARLRREATTAVV
jgi:cytidylate kinase